MDIEALEFRAACIQAARNFFISRRYLELDTPALAPALIPESCLEVFKTSYALPYNSSTHSAPCTATQNTGVQHSDIPYTSKQHVPLYLTPSPEVFIKPVIAQHRRSVFQLSKCYRNCESTGHIHNPEFTMLEYYTMEADYRRSITITEQLLQSIAEAVAQQPRADPALCAAASQPFLQLTMDEAFSRYAGFSLAEADTEMLAAQAVRQGLGTPEHFQNWAWDDLYELLLVHCVEPALPADVPVALLDYPARVPCLAAERSECRTAADGKKIIWNTKERWEVYLRGVELANCYTEERNAAAVDSYFSAESAVKAHTAVVLHRTVENFGTVCAKMPPCSGVAMGFDRLIMLLAGAKTLNPFLHIRYQ
ncbi:MAG: amino acid--tRNA ligase-related protein [Treponema sp.]